MRCICNRCRSHGSSPPPSPNPVMGRGLDAAYRERREFYDQLAREVGLNGPDYDACADYIGRTYGGR